MAFTVSLYAALLIFVFGLVYRVSRWFKRKVGVAGRDISSGERFIEALSSSVRVLAGRKMITLLKVFFLEIILQRKILKESPLRWVMHLAIYYGFILLLLTHALGEIVAVRLFPDYYPTANPFYFIRDFMGLVVIAGLLIAVYRRFVLKVPRMHSNARDVYGIVILAVIMVSGFSMLGLKITSHSVFTRMVEDYSDVKSAGDFEALESLWVKDYGLVSPGINPPFDESVIEKGRFIHEMNCALCHSAPQWSPGSYAVAKLVSPVALSLDRASVAAFLWWVHVLACLLGLAYLPFSKMFHIIVTPVSILVNAVTDKGSVSPGRIATIHAMELDACMHCATCSKTCSAGTVYDALGNEFILPGEKMQTLRLLADGKPVGKKGLAELVEGVYLCTNCDRCTVACPAGIGLRELWIDAREELIRHSATAALLSQYSFVRGLKRSEPGGHGYEQPLERVRKAVAGNFASLTDPSVVLELPPGESAADPPPDAGTFAYCFGCRTCTTVCPVVAVYDSPIEALGLLPHQIMCSMGLGLDEMASGARMIWDCVTCYQCQEHCPQKVCVTDVLYELKNLAVKRAEAVGDDGWAAGTPSTKGAGFETGED